MKNNYWAFPLLLVLLSICSTQSIRAASSSATAPAGAITSPSGLIVLRLDASKKQYSSGEPVLIRVQAFNRSAQPVFVFEASPWEATELVILRDGERLKPNVPMDGRVNRNPPYAQLHPSDSWTFHLFLHPQDAQPEYYNSVSSWGYHLSPGHYLLYVVPRTVALRSERQWVPVDPQDRSNIIEINVNP